MYERNDTFERVLTLIFSLFSMHSELWAHNLLRLLIFAQGVHLTVKHLFIKINVVTTVFYKSSRTTRTTRKREEEAARAYIHTSLGATLKTKKRSTTLLAIVIDTNFN